MSEIVTCKRERDADLCYCKPGFTGHVHGAKIDEKTWARGVLAIAALGAGSMATTTPKLSSRNRRAAEKILYSHCRHDAW